MYDCIFYCVLPWRIYIYRKSIQKMLKLSDLEFIILYIIYTRTYPEDDIPWFCAHICTLWSANYLLTAPHICTYNDKLKHKIPGEQLVLINFLLIILCLGASITRSRCYTARGQQMQAYWRHGLRGTHERLQHIQVKSLTS